MLLSCPSCEFKFEQAFTYGMAFKQTVCPKCGTVLIVAFTLMTMNDYLRTLDPDY